MSVSDMRVRVGHRTYSVEFTDDHALDDDGYWGMCDKRAGKITVVSRGRPLDEQAETLVHEIIHALCHNSGATWDDDEEEQIATVLGLRLTAFLADNAAVVDDLLRMLAR